MDIGDLELTELGFTQDDKRYFYENGNFIIEYWIDADWFLWVHGNGYLIFPNSIDDIKTLIKIICS